MTFTANSPARAKPKTRVVAGETILRGQRLRIDSAGELAVCDATEFATCIALHGGGAGAKIHVEWRTKDAWLTGIAAAETFSGNRLYAAASGKLTPTAPTAPGSHPVEGIAISDAAQDGDAVQFAPVSALLFVPAT